MLRDFRDFLATLYHDWLALVSGIASVALAVWVALYSPTNDSGRKVLWLTFAVCLFVAAYRIWVREHRRFLEAKGENERYRMIFHVDEHASSLAFKDVVTLNLVLRFENEDTHDWTMKRLDFSLHKIEPGKTREVTTTYSVLYRDYNSKVIISDREFEGMLVQGGRVTPYYEIQFFISIIERDFQDFKDGLYFVRVEMEATSQPIYTKDFHLAIGSKDTTASLISFTDEAGRGFRQRMRRLN